MFVLETPKIPGCAAELTIAVEKSLRKSIHLPAGCAPVVIAGELPDLLSLAIDVSHGEIDPDQPLPDPKTPADQTAGPSVETFTIIGQPISTGGIPLDFKLSASRVAFAYARNERGSLIATLRSAGEGHLALNLGQRELETGILAVAQRFAASSGVAILKVQAVLTPISPKELDVQLNITAKKFVSTNVRISGRLSVNDELIARATNLQADGDGMVGGIAVGFLRPHLQKLNDVPLPLMAFSLGSVKLRGVQVRTENGLHISAAFGSQGP